MLNCFGMKEEKRSKNVYQILFLSYPVQLVTLCISISNAICKLFFPPTYPFFPLPGSGKQTIEQQNMINQSFKWY